jgi:non-heme chloroperoxidase
VVFSHGWPLSADAFEDQMFFLASHGYRCIAHDRRGHGRSSQPWDGNDMDTLKTDANPAGTPLKAFDDLRAAVQKDRSQFWRDLSMPFYGYNRAGAKVSGGVRQSFWLHLATRSAGRPLSANSGRGSLPSTCRFVW